MEEIIHKKLILEQRTINFGKEVILFCKKQTQNTITKPLISQIVRSATSIGANYMEANGASSRKDFRNKIYICKKEAQETSFWLEMIRCAADIPKEQLDPLEKEVHELILIFGKIVSTLNSRN